MNRKYDLMTIHELERKAAWVRLKVLDMAVKAHSGHISTAFSQAEMLIALYQGGIMRVNPADPHWKDRDRFVLSKGQGGIGLYPVLADMGFFPLDDLDNFTGAGGHLCVHVEPHVPGIEFIMGSLGHGLPVCTGIAEVGKQEMKDWLVFCMLGDGELYEGSNWEAMMTASSRMLSNLVCIVDRNRQCTVGFTDEIEGPNDGPRLDPLKKKFEAFGFEVRECNGHDFESIFNAFNDIRTRKSNIPLCILSFTQKGHGASVMENKRLFHYRVPTGDDLDLTRKELELRIAELSEATVGIN